MWKDNLGLDVKIVNQEWQVFLETIKSKDTPQIAPGLVPGLSRCEQFHARSLRRERLSNPAEGDVPYGGINWKNEKFEELVKQAAVEQDPAKRVELYAQAEDILVNTDAAIIPIYWYTNLEVTKPYVTRTFSSGGHQRYEHWDIDMAAKASQ
jgi:oligopeptide transport system substrate-binding protein